MSARIPPGFAEIWTQYNQAADPEPMFTAIGVELASGVAPSSDLVQALTSIADGAIDNIVSSELTIGPGYMVFGQDGGDLRIDSPNPPVAGLNGPNALTINTAVLVRKLTASGGRRGRGRMYIPGLPEGNVATAGNITPSVVPTLQTAIDSLLTNLVAHASVERCVLFHDTAPFTPTTITSLEVQRKVATQRRRLRP